MSAPAGWYQDPSQADQLRYWDGTQWTQHTHASAPQSPAAQPTSPTPTASGVTPPASDSFATPASIQANPVSGMAPGVASSFASGQPSYTGAPAFTGTTSKKGLGAGAIVGIIVGAVALVGIIGVLAVVGLGSLADDAVAGDATPAASESVTPDGVDEVDGPVESDDPADVASVPADFSVPDGFVEVRHDDLGVAYGVPAEWYDISDLYGPIFGEDPEEISGEVVSFLSAWNTDSPDGFGSTDVMILHSQLPAAYGTELYSVGARKGFSTTAGDTAWTDAVTYTNDAGESVTVSTGTPTGPDTYLSTDMYVIGGGTSVVLVECIVYDETGSCDGVEAAVATMSVG
jgi:hypothetical protein